MFQGSAGAAGQQGAGSGAMTTAERAAVLDEQLRRTYETYDDILRREQADARGAANQAGGGAGGGIEPQTGGGQGGTQQNGGAGGQLPGGFEVPGDEGRPGPPASREEVPRFEPPEDIPSGRDDDVVARQLREAAETEPDPELREALWDEYRNYTGLGGGGQ